MNASRKKHDRIMAEIEATKAKLTKLEENAYAGPYKAKWWVAKRKRTEYEKKLFPEKHFDDLPGTSLPEGVIIEKDVPVEMSDGVKLAAYKLIRRADITTYKMFLFYSIWKLIRKPILLND